MFISNPLPIISCGKTFLRVTNLQLENSATNYLVDELGIKTNLTGQYFFSELLIASLIAGHLNSSDTDYAYFIGDEDAFIPSLRGIGRISLGEIVCRKTKTSFRDWVSTCKIFVSRELFFVNTLLSGISSDYFSSLITSSDWPMIISIKPEVDLAKFIHNYFELLESKINSFQVVEWEN